MENNPAAEERFTPPGWPRRVGGVDVRNPIWLAPLAGITFCSFRRFHLSLGVGLVHTEMVSALGLIHKGRKTKELLYGADDERPCALQLFGSNAADIAKGAEIALSIRSFDAVEVNMACPMPKVTKKGAGAKLMEFPDEAAEIMRALKSFGIPAWAKARIMPPGSPMSTAEFCEKLFNAGASFIFVHGRTPAQRYEGSASREEVGRVASRFPGMIGGSGDCYTPENFQEYLALGCAAVLAARGLLRDALLVPRALSLLGAPVPAVFCSADPAAQAEILLELGRNIYNTEGEPLALMIAKRMLGALFKGFAGAPKLRREGASAKKWADMENLLSRGFDGRHGEGEPPQ